MAFKFQRNYELQIDTNDGDTLYITTPLTVEFNIKKSTLAQAQTGNFKIYNLSSKTRNKIVRDRYQVLDYRQVIFKAGYGNNLFKIFQGNAMYIYSYRQGVNIITEIEAYDGGFGMFNGFSNFTVDKSQTQGDVFNKLVNDIPNLAGGFISDSFNQTANRGQVLFGNSYDLIKEQSDSKVFIENEEINILKKNEILEGESVNLIDFSDGLLETPKRSDALLIFKILFEPGIKIAQKIELHSIVNPIYNGSYHIIGYEHVGTISESVNAQCTTTVNLNLGLEGFNLLTQKNNIKE